MKKLLQLSVFLFLGILSLNAQTLQIKGRVLEDSTNTGLPNVSVIVVETQKGVSTDQNGNFSISVAGKGSVKLRITSIGYQSQTVTTNGSKPINIVLSKEQVTIGDEVVVIGYSSIKRKDLTGSVSSLGAKQLKDNPTSSAAEAIQGKLAGVQVTVSEGAPGADVVIKVRGGTSITQENTPLYIVDGIQVDNALKIISPQDIASIDVLKDASTTAIYGARAANGVIIITTKAGKAGKTLLTYNGSMGWRELPKKLGVLSPYDYVLWQYERSRNSIADSTSFAAQYGTTWDTLSNYKNVPEVNWQKEVFGRKAQYQNHNVSLSGGTAATTFNLGFTANKEDGILLESGYDRYLVSFKLDHKISDKLKIGMTVRYLDEVIRGAGTNLSGTRTTGRLRQSITYRPFELPTPTGGLDDFDEKYYLASGGQTNPILLTKAVYRRQNTRGTYLNGYLNYKILQNLVFRSTLGYNTDYITDKQFYSKITGQARQVGSKPLASIGQDYYTTINNSNTLQYSTAINKKHDITVLVGQEIVDRNIKNTLFTTRYFPADISAEKALANMGLGAAPTGIAQPLPFTFLAPPNRIFSFFGRVSYAFKDKYLATFNLRSDRSSKFNSENGSLIFPSASVAWRFSKEKFMDNVRWLSDGKIRFGYGTVGNNRIGDLLYQQLYRVNALYSLNGAILPGFSPSALSNPNLRWERNKTASLGLDLSLFNNKVQFTMDLYKNTANDLLLAAQTPSTTGYTSQLQNIGATSNRGIEFQISATPISKGHFLWTSNFNISINRNRVENLGGVQEITRNSGWQGSGGVDDYLVKVGQPIGLMYGLITDGFYKVEDFDYNATTKIYTLKPGMVVNSVNGPAQPGFLKYKDIGGGPDGKPDGKITVADRTVIGNANPNFTGGWNNQFAYKNFDMGIFVNFVVGNNIINANKLEWTDATYPDLNMLDVMKNRFTNIDAGGQRITDPVQLAALNTNAQIWAPNKAFNYWLHSWAVEDGSYLRINNLTVGYTVPNNILKKARLSAFRIFATVNNLSNITKYTGYDPDVSARRADPLTPGVDFAAYPRSRTWVFGLNVTF